MEALVKQLTEAFGPSGEESPVGSLIEQKIKDKVDRLYFDNLGNLIAIRKGPSPRVVISAHMDEIGVIITHLDERGFARLAPVGGVLPYLLVGQRVKFNQGLVGTVYHEKIKNIRELDWSKLYLDVEAGKDARVKIGDLAVLDQPFVSLGERYLAKAMDDRAGCAVLIETIHRLPPEVPQELCFVFSVQEEVGLRGARTAAYQLKPDFGLAVDVTGVGDTPKSPVMAVELGKGVAIKVKDSSVITHPAVRQFMIETAERHNIPYQLEVLERGGTDAGVIHLSREGVPTGALSIPCRYIHTPSEMIDSRDLIAAVDLLEKLCLSTWPA
ncbi:MAG TPA: M42 family metallopeptidase [Firmicutes bacterium]|nr:M42 family metallopeptidase [Bacillota bacterium]